MRNDFNSFFTICALFAMLELSTFELGPEFQSKRHVFHFVCGIAHCSEMIRFVLVKFIYSEKTSKFDKITLLLLLSFKKVRKFQNENIKSSYFPKYEWKNLKNSALNKYLQQNFSNLFIFWAMWRLHNYILKFSDL